MDDGQYTRPPYRPGERPARSVLFLAFGSEEQMMLGSYHYVAHPLRPLETTRAVLDLDMVCDHLPFLQKGGPAIWLFGGFHPGYHEPADTIDLLDFDKPDRVVRLAVASVRRLPSPGPPPRFRF